MSSLYKNSKKNREYWNNRISNTIYATYNSLEDKNRALIEMYQQAILDIQNELYRLGDKISVNGVITRSDMYKKNRLDILMKKYEKAIYKLIEDIEKFTDKNKREGIIETYKNIMKELGIEFVNIPHKQLEELMRAEWKGSFFSENLWGNGKVLVLQLKDILIQGISQGKTVAEMSIQISNTMNSNFNITHRLIRTETMNVLNNTAIHSYKDSGRVKEVQIWAAVDERLCNTCGKYHGNIYNIDDAPNTPLHPNCRCTVLPIIDKEEANQDHDKAKKEVKEEFKKR